MDGVSEDSDLKPIEKQFSITGVKEDSHVRVHSEVGSLTRKLLAHEDFEVESQRQEGDDVVAVTGTLPISYLSIKSSPRSSENWGQVVSQGVYND